MSENKIIRFLKFLYRNKLVILFFYFLLEIYAVFFAQFQIRNIQLGGICSSIDCFFAKYFYYHFIGFKPEPGKLLAPLYSEFSMIIFKILGKPAAEIEAYPFYSFTPVMIVKMFLAAIVLFILLYFVKRLYKKIFNLPKPEIKKVINIKKLIFFIMIFIFILSIIVILFCLDYSEKIILPEYMKLVLVILAFVLITFMGALVSNYLLPQPSPMWDLQGSAADEYSSLIKGKKIIKIMTNSYEIFLFSFGVLYAMLQKYRCSFAGNCFYYWDRIIQIMLILIGIDVAIRIIAFIKYKRGKG